MGQGSGKPGPVRLMSKFLLAVGEFYYPINCPKPNETKQKTQHPTLTVNWVELMQKAYFKHNVSFSLSWIFPGLSINCWEF